MAALGLMDSQFVTDIQFKLCTRNKERELSHTMQCPKIDLDNIPTSISEFFTPEEFADISEYEKQHLSNLRQNFEALRRFGCSAPIPAFMCRSKSADPASSESSEESDIEWTPALHRAEKSRVNSRTRFRPLHMTRTRKQQTRRKIASPKQRKRQTKATSKEEEVHVYPFRNRRVTSYMSLAVPKDDDFLYCEECNQEYDGDCPEHGALISVDDAEVTLLDHSDSDYSKRTLPEGLEIKKSKISNAGLGVFAVKDFPARTRFGPYRGKKETNEEIAHESGYSWQLLTDEKTYFLDARDPCESNWMRFVNCARHEEEQSVTAYQYKREIYYRSHKHIFAGTEILVYYGDSYARDLGIQIQRCGRKVQGKKSEEPNMDMDNDRIHSCTQCQLSFSTFQYLQKHIKHRHNDKYWEMKQNEMSQDMEPEVKTMKESKVEHNLGDVNIRDTESENNVPENVNTGILNIHMTKVSNGLNLLNEGSNSKFNKTVCNTDKHIELGGTGSLNTKCEVEYKKSRQAREKYIRCDVCDIKFDDSHSLKKHKRIHTGEKPYKCDVYSVEFNETGNLKRHRRIHTGEKPYKCDDCSVGFNQSGNLKKHRRIHTGENPYKCDVCSVGFNQSGHLKTHKRIHTGEKPYKCDVCSVGFNQSGGLKKHKRIHTGEKPYRCDVCNLGFTTNDNLKTHKRIHTGEKPYKCDVCSVGFNESGCLKKLKRIHTGEKPYRCDVCSLGFNQSGNLKTHKRIYTGEKPYKCDVCSVGFNQSGGLKKHKRIHTGEKPYRCDVCNVGFTTSYNLKKHKRIHTGEKPYRCDVCNVGFTTSYNLKKHKRIHTGEKPYKCDVCSVEFNQSGHLKTHKRIHTGEKPYKCDVCNVGFTTSYNLKKHKRIHTGEKTLQV